MTKKQKARVVEIAESLYQSAASYYSSDYAGGPDDTYDKACPEDKQQLDELIELVNGTRKEHA
jgi:hypothetical protein